MLLTVNLPTEQSVVLMVLMFDWNAGSAGNLRWEYCELLEILESFPYGSNYCHLQIKSVHFTSTCNVT